MGDHTADGAVEDARRSAVVEGTRLLRVDQVTLVQELVVAELCKAERIVMSAKLQ